MREKRGSALLYVMIIVVILVMVVAVVMVSSANANRQSAFTRDYEQLYYAAESIAQLSAEIFIQDLQTYATASSAQERLEFPAGLTEAQMDTKLETLFNQYSGNAEAALRQAFNTAATKAAQQKSSDHKLIPTTVILEITEKEISKNSLVLESEAVTTTSGNEVIETFLIKDAFIAAYLEGLSFIVTGTAGDETKRTAEVKYTLNGNLEIIPDAVSFPPITETTGEIWIPDATLGGTNGLTIKAGDSKYIDYNNRFSNLIWNAGDTAVSITTMRRNDTYTAANKGNTISGSTMTAAQLGNVERVHVNGNLTLNGGLTGARGIPPATQTTFSGNGRNDSVRYLFVDGNLTISASVYLPNLEEIYVTGNLTINGGVTFAGNNGTHDVGEGANKIAMINGTNVVVGGTMTVGAGSPTTIYDTRFYVPSTININGTTNGALAGNSVFIAYGPSGAINISTDGNNSNFNLGSETYAPQFYAGNTINLRAQGSPKYFTLMAALNGINNTGNSNVADMKGFMFISTGAIGQLSIPTNASGQLPLSAITNLMDYGLINSSTTRTVTQIGLNNVVYSVDAERTGIREIDAT